MTKYLLPNYSFFWNFTRFVARQMSGVMELFQKFQPIWKVHLMSLWKEFTIHLLVLMMLQDHGMVLLLLSNNGSDTCLSDCIVKKTAWWKHSSLARSVEERLCSSIVNIGQICLILCGKWRTLFILMSHLSQLMKSSTWVSWDPLCSLFCLSSSHS